MSSLTTTGNIYGSIYGATSAVVDYDGDASISMGETINIIIEDEKNLSEMLSLNYKEIRDDFIVFNVYVNLVKNDISPIEDVMRMISKKTIFNFVITRPTYTLTVKGVIFKRIKNLIETTANQYIEVEYSYDTMEYDNTLKTPLQKRAEKIDLLKDKIEKS